MTIKCPCCRTLLQVDASKQEADPIPYSKTINIDTIINLVLNRDGLELAQVQTRSRKRPVVQARYKIYWLSRKFTSLTLLQIANSVGKWDHTTVIHGSEVMAGLMQVDKTVQTELAAMCQILDDLRTNENQLRIAS